jgi:hypothetical protein
MIFIDYAPVPNCKNEMSMDMICVKCNECGRFDYEEVTDDEQK